MIPFHKPYFTGKESLYFQDVCNIGKTSGNGFYTQRCHRFFEERYGFKRCFLTSSCTDAIEMASLLFNIGPGDEVIVPSFTYVATANAFLMRGAKVVFADSCQDRPHVSPIDIAAKITPKTKAIVVVHYAGIACDMESIMSLVNKYNLWLLEDAAQAIDGVYKGKPLGSFGHLAAFSFHESKNISSGEGGLLVVNEEGIVERAEKVWQNGTNKAAYFRNEVDKYEWMDVGSSFLPSEMTAAFLYAQLEALDEIQTRRKEIWRLYYELLSSLKTHVIELPKLTVDVMQNGHLFYLVCASKEVRNGVIDALRAKGICATFHYIALHTSVFGQKNNGKEEILNAERYTNCLVRLPLYFELKDKEIYAVVDSIKEAISSVEIAS